MSPPSNPMTPPPGPTPPVTDAELHAWVDGQLDPARVPDVLAWLLAHPDDARRVGDWQAQRLALRQRARELDLGEAPPSLTATVRAAMRAAVPGSRPFPPWTQALAASVLLALGMGVGLRWGGTTGDAADRAPTLARGGMDGASSASLAGPPAYVKDAAAAHAVYTPEKRHPVEVTAEEQAHLVQWLSRRLGASLTVPDLTAQGYRLLGGRLLPGDGSPRAQFMYEHADGMRLTLYVTTFAPTPIPTPGRESTAPQPGEAAFRTTESEGRVSFYWMDERFGYALNAPSGAPQVQAVARQVYHQLERTVPNP